MNIHSNARTCPNSRAAIVEHVRAGAWSEDQAATMGVSARTGFKWWRRFREAGTAGLTDRSSRPHRIPNRTSPERTELVLQLRRCRLTAQEIATKLHMPRSTVFFQQLCAQHFIRHRRTRPYRPQTNGKAERFIQTMLREWAYKRPYKSSSRRTAALPRWLDRYNHRRPHGSLGGQSPIARVVTQREQPT